MNIKITLNTILGLYSPKALEARKSIEDLTVILKNKGIQYKVIDTQNMLDNLPNPQDLSLSFLQNNILESLKTILENKDENLLYILNASALREDQVNSILKYGEHDLFLSKLRLNPSNLLVDIKKNEFNVDLVKTESDYNDIHGPFDIIGDIHGCYDELCELIENLGYKFSNDKNSYSGLKLSHPDNRKLVLLGDLCDRGIKNINVVKFVMDIVETKMGICVLGNHDLKLIRYLEGEKVPLKHGWNLTAEELDKEPLDMKNKILEFIKSLPSHIVLDNKKLVCVHAGIRENMIGKEGGKVKDICCHGEKTDELDEYGMLKYKEWANSYLGSPIIAYGHVWHEKPVFVNNAICLDTGCVFGDSLTAMRYPELTFESVKAKQYYFKDLKKPKHLESLNDRIFGI
jgi:diadenosine tetraphosphatase ApaH/serine/threonine PP2A family protein phosphatase